MQKSKIPGLPTNQARAGKNQKCILKFKNFGFWFVILIFGLWILDFNCFAQEVSIKDLIENARDFDGQMLTIEGEAIGDIINSSNGVWVNINDKGTAIGVFCPRTLVKEINYLGNYKTKGDRILVTGTFHHACMQHGGDMDVHAQQITKISPGCSIKEELPVAKKRLAIYLSGAVLCLLILQNYKMRRPKKSKA